MLSGAARRRLSGLLLAGALGVLVLLMPAPATAATTDQPVTAEPLGHEQFTSIGRAVRAQTLRRAARVDAGLQETDGSAAETGAGDRADGSGAGATPAATDPRGPSGPKGPTGPRGGVSVDFDDVTHKPSTPIVVLLGITLLSLVPAILLTCTSFTKILVVLSLTRNALGLQQVPPNQVLAGLALFLSLFIMSPVLGQMNHDGVQPYLHGTKTQTQAFEDGVEPLRSFMLKQSGNKEIALLTEVAHRPEPKTPDDVALTTLIPAFILSELRQAFIIGFMIFIPFLVIDIVVSAGLMSLGMMMMPPVMVSLPFKILLFVMVDGWGLIIKSLVQSYGAA